jgi:hypothetical protein
MLSSAKRLGVLALFGAAVALVTAAHGQVNLANSPINRTNTFTQGAGSNIVGSIGPRILSTNYSIGSNPYNPSTGSYATCYGYCPGYGGGGYSGCYGGGQYGYGGYSGGYCQDPFNGFLTGAASVISSQSQFVVAKRQAQLINEQSKQAAVDTQHKIYEEWKYERNDQPTLEQIRRDAWEQAYKRAVFHPPLNDIWSADALNRILDHASRLQARGLSTNGVQLPEDLLKRINFSTGVAGNIGALKNKGKLDWPAILGRKDFAAERDRFNQLAADAVRQGGENNKVDAGVLEDMDRDLGIMDDKLTSRIRDLAPDDYLEAKRYLQDLRSALRILKRPDVAKHINNEYAVNAKTVNELVQNMANAGVRFAKARDGEEWAYNALYRAMLSYDLGLSEKSGGDNGSR